MEYMISTILILFLDKVLRIVTRIARNISLYTRVNIFYKSGI